MQRAHFFGDQLVLSDDLNSGISNLASQSVLRTQALLGSSGGYGTDTTYARVAGGVYGSPASYASTDVNLRAYALSNVEISIAVGKALTPAGEMIVVPEAILIDAGTPSGSVTYNGVQVGYLNWVLSGNESVTNYVKIAYTEFPRQEKTDDDGTSFYTRYDAGFTISVDRNVPTAQEILLGTFTADGSGQISGSITDKRLYVRSTTTADAVALNPTTKPVSSHTTVDDHVRAVGSATPTNTNPHGLTLSDIGGNNIGVQHMQTAHVSAIMLQGFDAESRQSYSASVVNGGIDYLSFYSPTSASVAINGTFFTGSVVNLSADEAPIMNGTYWAVIDASGTPQWISSSVIPADGFDTNPRLYPQYVPIAYGNITTGGDIENLVDKRQFYTTHPKDIRGDMTEAYTFDTLTRSSSLENNLNRIRYALGRALTGAAAGWTGASYPLTDGGTLADATYHQHSGTTGTTFTLRAGSATDDDAAFRVQVGTSPTSYAGLYYDAGEDTWTAYLNTDAGTYAKFVADRFLVGSGLGQIGYSGTTFSLYQSDGVTLAMFAAGSGSVDALRVGPGGGGHILYTAGGIFELRLASGLSIAAGVQAQGLYAGETTTDIRFIANGAQSFAIQYDASSYGDLRVRNIYDGSGNIVVGTRVAGFTGTYTGADSTVSINATTITATDGNIQTLSKLVLGIVSALKPTSGHGLIA